MPTADSFVRRVEWESDLPAAWRPHDDTGSPVRCRPSRRFDRPAISGISTAAIIEHVDGGESADDVAEQFGLTLEDVRWAVVYETSRAEAACVNAPMQYRRHLHSTTQHGYNFGLSLISQGLNATVALPYANRRVKHLIYLKGCTADTVGVGGPIVFRRQQFDFLRLAIKMLEPSVD